MTEDTTPAEHDALAGLRRIVLHSRDQLRATAPRLPSIWVSGAKWTPDEIRQYAATLLAIETLTLVADCLPEGV